MAGALPLNLEPLLFELHVVQVLDGALSGSAIHVLKKAEAAIVCWIKRIFLKHEFAQLAE